jgi:hypothetical protein
MFITIAFKLEAMDLKMIILKSMIDTNRTSDYGSCWENATLLFCTIIKIRCRGHLITLEKKGVKPKLVNPSKKRGTVLDSSPTLIGIKKWKE